MPLTFNSVVFLFRFLPLVLLVYYLVPAPAKNAVLLLASLAFYCWGGITWLPLVGVLLLVCYLAGLALARPGLAAGVRRALLVGAIAVCAGALAWFKYDDFLIPLLKSIAGGAFASLRVPQVLPLGISYYTFKLISYLADVYTHKTEAERDPLHFCVYGLFFPQLIVGPIIKYRDMRAALHAPATRCTAARMEAGAEMFVFGLAKAVLLSDMAGALWQDIVGAGGIGLANASTPLVWLGVLGYSFQLYFNFAGFSEMSNGLALLLGFECAANFDLPYTAASITEFWRRWHISLSGWFREYIYIPLGGNRRGLPRQILNLLAVWLLTGIWHGSTWNFICWGFYYFVLLTLEKLFLLPLLKKGRVWPHLYTLLCVAVGWALFAADAPGAPLGLLLGRMFLPQGGVSALYYLRNYGVTLALCAVCSTPLPGWLWQGLCRRRVARVAVFAGMMVLCVAFVVGSTSSTALYAGF